MVVGVTKRDALDRARRIELSDITGDLPSITPTDAELKESGAYHKARIELMRNKATEAQLQQEKYLNQLAGDLKLKVIPIRGLGILKRETGYEWTNGWTKHGEPTKERKIKVKPAQPVPIKHIVIGKKPRRYHKMTRKERIADSDKKIRLKPKNKRLRLHTARNGKTPRVLRKAIKNGYRVFSFSDDIWKVKSPKRKRRKKR